MNPALGVLCFVVAPLCASVLLDRHIRRRELQTIRLRAADEHRRLLVEIDRHVDDRWPR